MADLTRFDFHAKRFYFSEKVRVMSAEEVGQYLLLLVESWMGSKDASLPDNLTLLARYARVTVVSESVLAMFPVIETEHGPRRRNATLHEEWVAAIGRSEQGRMAVSKRADRQQPGMPDNIVGTYKAPTGLLLGDAKGATYPSQAKPVQAMSGSGPDQTGPESNHDHSSPGQPNTAAVVGVDRRALPAPAGASAPEPRDATPDFKTFRITWRSLLKKPLGHNKTVEAAYQKACEEYGGAVVLTMLHNWATPRTVEWASSVGYPFGAFIKQLPKLADAAAEDAEEAAAVAAMESESNAEEVELAAIPAASAAQLAGVENNIAQIAADEARRRAERRTRFAQAAPAAVETNDPNDYVTEK